MKKIILLALMAVILATPCFAQDVELEGSSSLDGTLWRMCGIELTSYPPFFSMNCDKEIGFDQGMAYQSSAGFACEPTAFYIDLGAVSIAWAIYEPLHYYLAIMQPTIGFGALTYGGFLCGCYYGGKCSCAAEYYIGIMYKTDDNWTPSEIE